MKILETFICYIKETKEYVKVHRVRNKQSIELYFLEKDNKLDEIGRLFFEEISKF